MPSKNAFGIKSLREAAEQRVTETSLRAVAEEIGMGKSALHAFIKGSAPHSGTRQKIVSWYVETRSQTTSPRGPSTADIDAAISLLARYIQRDSRPEAQAKRLDAVLRRVREQLGKVTG